MKIEIEINEKQLMSAAQVLKRIDYNSIRKLSAIQRVYEKYIKKVAAFHRKRNTGTC